MSSKLCKECGVHEIEEDDLCRFCLDENDEIDPVPVDVQMRRSQGRRIAEGFSMMKD